jgi:hypothetical protein
LWAPLLKYHKNIRFKNIVKILGMTVTSDSRALSLAATPNPTIIFTILIIIFYLSAKIFIFLIFQKNYGFSLMVIIVFKI